MHQLNKQTVELSLFEQQGPGANGQFSTERFIILFLIALGFVGLFYSLPTKAGSISAITTNTNFSSAGDEFAVAFVPKESRKEIQVLNAPIVGKETQFQVPSSSTDFKVVSINFGDGISESTNMKTKIGHTYTRPGKYEVIAKAIVRHDKVLYMRKTIEVKSYSKK